MTNNIVINNSNRTIEITKKFAAAAKRFGTAEYEDLQSVRKDYPQYRIQIKVAGKKADTYKGLTFTYMKDYILKKNNDEMLKTFYELCGKDEEGKDMEFAPTASYGEIRKWFLEQNKELKAQRDRIEKILNKKAA